MEFRTIVDIPKPRFQIEPFEEMLFVGSCFADSIGQCFVENKFRATVNPYGTMYNPASVLHTVERFEGTPRVVFITLGTNHVYRLKETGEIVDNCQKRPAALFQEEELTVDECADYLRQTVELLCRRRPAVHVVFTVSPIRYRKYGYHESQLSKATLLLAVDKVCIGLNGLSRTSQARVVRESPFPSAANNSPEAVRESPCPSAAYFPAYEILMDELRDYRFYADDMIHLSQTAEEYIFERMTETYCSEKTRAEIVQVEKFMKGANHRIADPESPATHAFAGKILAQAKSLEKSISGLDLSEEIAKFSKISGNT